MNKKTKISMLLLLIVAIVLILVAIFTAVKTIGNAGSKIEDDGIAKVTIRMMGTVSASMKEIDKEKDIKTVIKHINTIDKKKLDMRDIYGWNTSVQCYDGSGELVNSISLCGTYMNIDGDWYEVADDEVANIRELYERLDYPKEDVISE